MLFLIRHKANEKQIEAAIDAALVASIFEQEASLCFLEEPGNFPAELNEKYQQLVELHCRIVLCPEVNVLRQLLASAKQVFSY